MTKYIAVVGPRRSGKTTAIQQLIPCHLIFSLSLNKFLKNGEIKGKIYNATGDHATQKPICQYALFLISIVWNPFLTIVPNHR